MKNFPAALAIQLPAPSSESHRCDQCLVSFQRYFVDILSSMLLPWWLSSREYSYQCRRHRRCKFNPWVRRSLGVGNGNPLQYSFLEYPMDRRAWWATVHNGHKELATTKRLSMHTKCVYRPRLLPKW